MILKLLSTNRGTNNNAIFIYLLRKILQYCQHKNRESWEIHKKYSRVFLTNPYRINFILFYFVQK